MEKLNKVFRTAQLAAIDKYTIEHEPVSSLDLMERAAGIWTDRFLKIFTEVAGVVVIAGNGNNGGDGYAIARLLNRRGVPVRVFRIAGTQDRSPDCEANYRRWLTRGKVEELKQADDLVLQKGEIVIDAIFGSGLNRPVTGLAARIIKQMNASANRVVAVDIPSGLAGEDNTWNDPETIVCAEYTFTFQFPKLEKGKNKVELAEEMSKSDYEDYINSKLIWDPARYLNVWLAKYSTSSSVSNTYSVSAPEVILEGYESIPGLKMQVVSDYSASDVENYTDVGMMINIRDFFATDGKSYFDLSLVFGLYYGLLYTDQDDNNTFVNGDNDYCPDTYAYYSGYSSGIYKNNRLYREDVDAEYEWFTSFNIMDNYSRRNSITVNQAERIRMIVERCPSRWAYKSSWAFTGKE